MSVTEMKRFTQAELKLMREVAQSMAFACGNDQRDSLRARSKQWAEIAAKLQRNERDQYEWGVLSDRVDELEEAVRCVLPYHAHISSFVMNKLHKALKETTE